MLTFREYFGVRLPYISCVLFFIFIFSGFVFNELDNYIALFFAVLSTLGVFFGKESLDEKIVLTLMMLLIAFLVLLPCIV